MLRAWDGGAILQAGDNTRNQKALLDLLQGFEAINTTETGSGDSFVSFSTRCVRYTTGGACDYDSILSAFAYDEATILADSNVLATINTAFTNGLLSPVGRELTPSSILGAITTDSNDQVGFIVVPCFRTNNIPHKTAVLALFLPPPSADYQCWHPFAGLEAGRCIQAHQWRLEGGQGPPDLGAPHFQHGKPCSCFPN